MNESGATLKLSSKPFPQIGTLFTGQVQQHPRKIYSEWNSVVPLPRGMEGAVTPLPLPPFFLPRGSNIRAVHLHGLTSPSAISPPYRVGHRWNFANIAADLIGFSLAVGSGTIPRNSRRTQNGLHLRRSCTCWIRTSIRAPYERANASQERRVTCFDSEPLNKVINLTEYEPRDSFIYFFRCFFPRGW